MSFEGCSPTHPRLLSWAPNRLWRMFTASNTPVNHVPTVFYRIYVRWTSWPSMPSSPRQSIETPAVCGRAISCIQINAHCSRKRPCDRFQYFARSKNVQLCTTPSTDISWTLDILFFTKYTNMWYNGQLCIVKCVKHTAQILCSCLQIIYGITCKFVIQFSHNIPSVLWIS